MDYEKMSALALTILIGIAYLIGYSYLDGFYKYYDLPLSEMNFGLQYTLAHAVVPLKRFFIAFAIALVAACTIVAVLIPHKIVSINARKSIAASACIVFIFYIAFCLLCAQSIGRNQAGRDFETLNHAAIEGPSGVKLEKLMNELDGAGLYYLVSSDTMHILVIKFRGSARKWVAHVPVDGEDLVRVYLNP